MCRTTQFRSFTLPKLLPDGYVLIVNYQAYFFDHCIVTQLAGEPCGIVAQQVFTEQELLALVALLEAWPSCASYEALIARLAGRAMVQARQVVHQAMQGQALESTLNPLCNLLARCRPRMRDFGMDIAKRTDGYQLVRSAALSVT